MSLAPVCGCQCCDELSNEYLPSFTNFSKILLLHPDKNLPEQTGTPIRQIMK
jgi:hypothetical protein